MILNIVKYEHLKNSDQAIIPIQPHSWIVNSFVADRSAIFSTLANQWVLFIDSDVELNPKKLEQIQSELPRLSQSHVYCGMYENPAGASIQQQAHNALSNFWLQQGHNQPQPTRLLGGFFMLFLDPQKISKLPKIPLFWGGEDVFLGYELQKVGFQLILKPEWKLAHHTSNSFKHFIKRAWLHGWNHRRHPRVNSSDLRLQLTDWIRFLKTQQILCGILIMFHFMLFFCAKIIRNIFP